MPSLRTRGWMLVSKRTSTIPFPPPIELGSGPDCRSLCTGRNRSSGPSLFRRHSATRALPLPLPTSPPRFSTTHWCARIARVTHQTMSETHRFSFPLLSSVSLHKCDRRSSLLLQRLAPIKRSSDPDRFAPLFNSFRLRDDRQFVVSGMDPPLW